MRGSETAAKARCRPLPLENSARARSPKRQHPHHHREDRQSPENTRHTHEPIERDKEWREVAGAGTAHEQSQNNEQSDRHRQQTTARPHMMTMIRHEIRRNPAPRRDIRPRLQDEHPRHPQAVRKRRRVGKGSQEQAQRTGNHLTMSRVSGTVSKQQRGHI